VNFCSFPILISQAWDDLISESWLSEEKFMGPHCNVGFQAIPNGNSEPFATLMQCGNRKRAYGEN
jgi:hypothetical protein